MAKTTEKKPAKKPEKKPEKKPAKKPAKKPEKTTAQEMMSEIIDDLAQLHARCEYLSQALKTDGTPDKPHLKKIRAAGFSARLARDTYRASYAELFGQEHDSPHLTDDGKTERLIGWDNLEPWTKPAKPAKTA